MEHSCWYKNYLPHPILEIQVSVSGLVLVHYSSIDEIASFFKYTNTWSIMRSFIGTQNKFQLRTCTLSCKIFILYMTIMQVAMGYKAQSSIYGNLSIPKVLPTQSRDAVVSTFHSSPVLYFQPFLQTWLDEDDSSLQFLYSRKTYSLTVVLVI